MNLESTLDLFCNRKLHYRTQFQGLPISVENRRGSVREGCDKKWGCWRTKMKVPYGYLRGTKGMDGAEVDVFVGPKVDAKMAYVVTIKKQPEFKEDDEQKVMLGFPDAKTAKRVFLQHYDDQRFFGKMDEIPMEEFKKKVLEGPRKIAADAGEPQVYPYGTGSIEPELKYHPPSLKRPKRVPTDDPMEKDDTFGDVTKRRERGTKGFRDRLSRKKGFDTKYAGIRTTQVSGFPSVTVGGFG